MLPRFSFPFTAAFLIASSFSAGQALAQDQATRLPKVEDLYSQNCAACHGANMEGGIGASLTKGYWIHGSSDEDLTRAINQGFPDLGMPPWEGTLSPAQIRTLVIYIREKEQAEAVKRATPPRPKGEQLVATKYQTYRMETLTRGLHNPWGLAFLPDGRMLVTEKSGPVRIISADGKQVSEPIKGTPPVMDHGQGGMMAVGVHPDYARNGWVYLGFADGWKDDKNQVHTITAVARGRIKDGNWVDQEWIYRPDKQFYTGAGVHFGTRFVFDKGYLFFVVGERGGGLQAQDIKRPNGKIFRLFDDGKTPPDNPFVGQPGAEEGIWSYGHRNPQGLAMDPRDGSLWDTEHAPRGGDEFNLVKKGLNYGWPVITYGMDYDGRPMPNSGGTTREGMEQPVKWWVPSPAMCGLTFYTGDKFPQWKNDFLAGSLKNQELFRLRVADGKLAECETVLSGAGRIRSVETGPDGYIYLLFNGPDTLARLVPVEAAPAENAAFSPAATANASATPAATPFVSAPTGATPPPPVAPAPTATPPVADSAPKSGRSPADHLPPHIMQITWFGERADWSADGKKILFLSKTFGDAMEYDLATKHIRNLTAYYPHHGYTRALYLSNGDILLSGPTTFDPRRVREAREQCELFVLGKGLDKPAVPLGTKCFEGPAVSRHRLHIAWTHIAAEYPDQLAAGTSRMQEADLVYENGVPKLANERPIIVNTDLPFRCTLETQNFRPPEEKELTFSAYGFQGTEVCGIDLETKKVRNYSNAPDQYDEPEGIFPDGASTLVECDKGNHQGPGHVDLWRLKLDGSGNYERLTYFGEDPGFKASNPVVSDDGKFIAFQLATTHEAAGVGHGIFVYDLEKAAANPR